jgi:hypothetical protein
VRECSSCGSAFDQRFRYCPWCGALQRLKIVEYFQALPFVETDRTRGLRVSRYFGRPGHVRFSIWDAGEVRAAVSLDEQEARRLATFVRGTDPSVQTPRFTTRLRQRADALIDVLR